MSWKEIPYDMESLECNYREGERLGLSYMKMLDNIDKHAASVARRIERCITGDRLWDLNELFAEATNIKDYRQAFLNMLMEKLRKVDYRS